MTLRVTYVQSHLFMGSTEKYLSDLIAGLDRDRFAPSLVCPDAESLAPLRESVSARTLTVPAVQSVPGRIASLRHAIRAARGDIVHSADFDPAALLAARVAGSRHVVVTYNTPELRPSFNAVGRAIVRAAWATRPWTIFTSDADRRTAIARDPVDAGRTAVIPFGFDVAAFARGGDRAATRAELGVREGATVVGTVGLLREQKRHVDLLRAFEQVRHGRPELELVIVGDGPLRAELESEVRARGLDAVVHLPGLRDDIPAVLAAFDLFALSSAFEGMCYAVAEALAAERPVVATAVGGVPQSVVDGVTGLLAPAEDVHALAAGIERLLADPSLASRLATAGRARVQELYALDTMAERTQQLYERISAA